MAAQPPGPKRPVSAKDPTSQPAATEKGPARPADAGGSLPWLPLLGLLIGAWAIVPPYIHAFGKLNVEHRVEITDHVIPGIAVLLVCALGFFLLRSPAPSGLLLLMAGGVVALAGFWMVATHVGLIHQARQGTVPTGALVWHGLPGVVVLLLGLVWTVRYWDVDEAPSAS